ncbi:MAG: hypothetical protein CMO55_18080 [Verrucomicrobiales bacterium]|nr:hypothetical protein [Verrucomicrobiales bacterium]
MKRTTVFGIVLLTIALHVPSFAQLKTRSELLQQKYIGDRSKGLIALNERYIEAFYEQLRTHLTTTNWTMRPHRR